MIRIERMVTVFMPVRKVLDGLSPVLDLAVRLWVANVFWKAGMTKIQSWGSTLFLFTYEYQVPVIPAEMAAPLAAGIELVFPVLLALGLATRFSALVLFAFNVAAVVSYPGLGEVGLKDHYYWGLLLLVPLLHGPGRLSLDHFLGRRFMG